MNAVNPATKITKSDFIVDATTDSAGNFAGSAVINPGRVTLFPWLSRLALSFDRYRFTKLSFVYKPRAGLNTAGVVTIAYDPSSTDGVPSAIEARQMKHKVEGSVRNRVVLNIPPSELRSV